MPSGVAGRLPVSRSIGVGKQSLVEQLQPAPGGGQPDLRDARPVMARAEHDVRTADEAAALGRLGGSAGRRLPPELAQRFGRLLGHDFAHVMIHTDGVAAAAAAQLGARAFTIGNEIYFASGAYAPGAGGEGERLLIHELTHVMQHDRGALAAVAEGQSRVSSPGDAHEHEARAMEGRAGASDAHTSEPRTAGARGGAGSRAPVLRDVHGIPNGGNDCFMNAVLQLLATGYPALFDPAMNPVAVARRGLQAELHQFITAIRGGKPPAYKIEHTKQLRALLRAHKIVTSDYAQEDAAETLRQLLDFVLSLEGRVLQVRRKPVLARAGETLGNRKLGATKQAPGPTREELLHENPELAVLDLYTFDRRSELAFAPSDAVPRVRGDQETNASVYDASGKSTRIEADLSMVEIEMSAYDSFEQFMGQHYGVGIDDALRPGHEHHAVDHKGGGIAISRLHKTYAFARLPQVITFVVQRFFGDIKLNDAFPMPHEMVLKEATEPEQYCRYQMRATVVHASAEAEQGHYIAEVRDDVADGRGWLTADDAHVTQNAKDEPQRAATGYLYTYVLLDRSPDAPASTDRSVVQNTRPEPRKRAPHVERPRDHAATRTSDLGTTSGGAITTDKRGLPNVRRGDQGKSDCFINAIVQLAAGPYRDQFDPENNKLAADAAIAQKLVWTLIGKIDKTDPRPPTSGDVAALRDDLVRRDIIKTKDLHEDASEVLIGLLRIVSGKTGGLTTRRSRTLDLDGAKPIEVTAEARKGFMSYARGQATDEAVHGNGYLPVDIRQYSNIHQSLYRAYGAGGEHTAFTEDNRPRVTNDNHQVSIGGYTQRTAIVALPPVMTFQLQRLPAETALATGKAAQPDLRPFYMPPSLVLVEQPDAGRKQYVSYQLRGVVTWQSAHYTARVAHGDQWFDFNDEVVHAAAGSGDVLTGGYLYTYVAGPRVAEPPHGAAAMQEAAPRTGRAPLGDELAIDYDANAIMHTPTQRNLRAVLQQIGGHFPVLIDPAKAMAVGKAQSLVEGLGMLSASGVTAESELGLRVIASCKDVVTALGAGSLAAAARGQLPPPAPSGPQHQQRGTQALAAFMYPMDGKDADLSKLKVAEIRAALARRQLADSPKLQAYLLFRARKEFYEGVHLVYDLDQTLITYNDGTYTPPAAPGEVTGELALKFEDTADAEPAQAYPFAIDAVVPSDTSAGDYQASYRRSGGARAWRQHHRPKTGRERGERGATLDTRGQKLGGEPQGSTTTPEGGTAQASGPYVRPAPSNQKGSAKVRAMSVRPGAIDALHELDGYGVHQSVWTHNSEHHMHRVLELFEDLGFAEHRFDKTLAAQGTKLAGKKPLTEFGPTPGQSTILLDDAAHRGNTELGDLGGEGALKPLGGDRTGELQVPAWGDPGKKFADAGKASDLRGLLGDRLMVRLALGQVAPAAESDDPLAREFLDAMKAIVSPSAPIADGGLLAALDKFLATDGAQARLRADFQRFQPPPSSAHPGEDPSLFALTPSLGASLIFPDKLPSPGAVQADGFDASAAKTTARTGYKGANIVSRGLIETEVHASKRYVRVYQAEANAIARKDAPTTIFKDVHQVGGVVDLVKGKGAVCFSVGTPLRTLKWFEKYQEEHFDKGFNPVIRSFLIPLDVYVDMASRANVQEQSSHPRYQGKQVSTNVDIAGDTDQYETREFDLELLRTQAVAGSLVSWALDNKRLEHPVSGDVRPIRELYDRLGIPPFSGLFTAIKLSGDQEQTYDPFTEKGGHRISGMKDRARELSELHATHQQATIGADPSAYLETRYDGSARRGPAERADDMSSFLRMHFYNPPKGKAFDLAQRIETEVRAPLERERALAKQATEWERLKLAASAKGEPAPAQPKLPEIRLSYSELFQELEKPGEPRTGILAQFTAARLEYEGYLKSQRHPIVIPATWVKPRAFFDDVLMPVVREARRYDARMARIAEERAHHEAELRAHHRPVPRWADDVEFFLAVLVPGAATQFMVTEAIGDNVAEARADLSAQHPGHARPFDALWSEHASAGPTARPPELADTPMKAIDYGQRKRENREIRAEGEKLSKLIGNPQTTAKQIIDQLLISFPALQEKFDEESNPSEHYTFAQHAERVIAQYLTHFRAGKHPLLGLDAVIKMILFHDMDKVRGKKLRDPGKAPSEELARVTKHTGLSAGTIKARFARRLELAKGPHADPDSVAEHVLPAMMMERYGALWNSPDETRMAIALMDGDPIGALAKAAGQKTPDLGKLGALRRHAFQEIVAMAGRGGIPVTDHAGIAAFYYQLLQFYQADSSSYSTAGKHTVRDGDRDHTSANSPLNQIYARTGDTADAPLAVNAGAGGGSYKGFLTFKNPTVVQAIGDLTRMFDDVGATMAALAKEGAVQARPRKAKVVVDSDSDDGDGLPIGLAGLSVFAPTFDTAVARLATDKGATTGGAVRGTTPPSTGDIDRAIATAVTGGGKPGDTPSDHT